MGVQITKTYIFIFIPFFIFLFAPGWNWVLTPVIKQRFASSSFSKEELKEVSFSSYSMYIFLCLVLFPNFFSRALSLWDRFKHSTFIYPCLHTRNNVKLEELSLFPCWFFSFPYFFRNLLNFLVSNVKVFVSLLMRPGYGHEHGYNTDMDTRIWLNWKL